MINLKVNGMQVMEAVTHRTQHPLVRRPVEVSRLLVAAWGMGMGLPMFQSISQSQRGRISASSNDGLGATVQFTPLLKPENIS